MMKVGLGRYIAAMVSLLLAFWAITYIISENLVKYGFPLWTLVVVGTVMVALWIAVNLIMNSKFVGRYM